MLRAFKVACLVLLAAVALPCPAASGPVPAKLKGKVVRVADGDTVTIRLKDGTQEKIRFYGIDAPESDQDYGDKSREKLVSLIDGKTITVKTHRRDQYDRVLGDVYLGKKDISLIMVKEGCAWHYDYYAPELTELEEAQKQAQAAKKGLWNVEGEPTAPWDFRRGGKTADNKPQKNPAADVVPDSGKIYGQVMRVTDGDTLTVRMENGREEKVQLLGIDAPEMDQEYGREARQKLSQLVQGKHVDVVYPGREGLGRINGKVYFRDQYINLILVQEGCAWHSEKYGPNEADLREAHQQAKEAKKGLWTNPNALEPWKHRNQH